MATVLTKSRLISGHGNANPEVMLVSDFAQGEDLTTGYALSGYKEALLKQFSRQAKLDYNQFYKTCLLKGPLPKLEWEKKLKPSDSEMAHLQLDKMDPHFGEILINEIKSLKPNLVISLGEMSFQYLTDFEGIRKFRGSILRLSSRHQVEKYTKILPILGPYPYLNKEYNLKFITQLDFNKISKWLGNQPIPDDTYQIWVAKNSTALRNFIERQQPICEKKTIEEGGFLVFDIETYMNIPTCISFCFDGFESCCIPILDSSIDFDNRALMLQQVAELLASPIPKVNQNIKYDWKTLERFGFRVNNIVGDTMLAASTIYCEFPKNLGFLTSIYTDLPYFKDEGRQFDPSKHKREQFYLYNAKDSLSTHQIYSKQIPEIAEQGVRYPYLKLIELMPIYRKMEDRGIRIDALHRQRLIAKYQTLFYSHKLILQKMLNEPNFNPLSASQCNRLIFKDLGYKTIQGVKGTDDESLKVLLALGQPHKEKEEYAKQILREVSYCRKLHKVLEVLELDLYPDDRFRCEFNLSGTETGRTSASKTTDYFFKINSKKGYINLGHSLQTIGKHGFYIDEELYGTDIRSMFVPSPGYVFVEIDLSGAEARVDRVLSGDFNLEVFDKPGIHKLTGSWIFDCDPLDIKKGTHQYDIAKTVRHAAEKNITAKGLYIKLQDEAVDLNIGMKETELILEKVHEKEPGIRNVFHRQVRAAIDTEYCLVCPNGRRRDFFDRISHHVYNEGIAFLGQAIVSDQNKFSFIRTFDEAPWASLLSEAHDAGFSEVPRGKEMVFYETYKRNIETPIDFSFGSLKRNFSLVIPCEASVGENWEEMEDLK